MFIKKFEAGSMEQALALVKQELGPGALILSTEQRPGSWFQKGMVEITAAMPVAKKKPDGNLDEKQLIEIFPHRKLEQRDEPEAEKPVSPKVIRRRFRSAERTIDVHEEYFLTRGFGPGTAKELATRLELDYSRKDLANPVFLEKARRRLIIPRIRTMTPEALESRNKWIAIGPPGSGKTSLLVKLALRLRGKGKRVTLVGMDKRKLVGRTELSHYARLLKVPFQLSVDRVSEGAIQLIDSPALDPNEPSNLHEVKRLCEQAAPILVLDAGLRVAELVRYAETAEEFGTQMVAFTRIDQLAHFGSLYDFFKETKLPLLGASISPTFSIPFRSYEAPELAGMILNGRGLQ